MKKLLTTLALSTLALNATANEESFFGFDPVSEWTYSIAYNVATAHHLSDTYEIESGQYGVPDKEVPWNEDNKFVGFRVNVEDDFGIFVAYGKNSFYEDSFMAGVETQVSNNSDTWDLGSDFGIATGYEEAVSSGNLPFINPFIRYNQKLTEDFTGSVKLGMMNFMAFNVFVELTF